MPIRDISFATQACQTGDTLDIPFIRLLWCAPCRAVCGIGYVCVSLA